MRNVNVCLGDLTDISVKGLEIVKKCSRVYLEHYTSILDVSVERMSEFYGKELIVTDRNMVESTPENIYENSNNEDVAFLVVGDPLSATTHIDLYLRAKRDGYRCQIIHNTSIINAVACTGLQLYRFGETVSIPYFSTITPSLDNLPDGFYDKIVQNYMRDLHTLCLLDIRIKEPTLESLMRGKQLQYEPTKFMSASDAAKQLVDVISFRSTLTKPNDIIESNMCIGLARVGSDTQAIRYCSIKEMCDVDLGKPLHSLIIPAKNLHFIETEFLNECLT